MNFSEETFRIAKIDSLCFNPSIDMVIEQLQELDINDIRAAVIVLCDIEDAILQKYLSNIAEMTRKRALETRCGNIFTLLYHLYNLEYDNNGQLELWQIKPTMDDILTARHVFVTICMEGGYILISSYIDKYSLVVEKLGIMQYTRFESIINRFINSPNVEDWAKITGVQDTIDKNATYELIRDKYKIDTNIDFYDARNNLRMQAVNTLLHEEIDNIKLLLGQCGFKDGIKAINKLLKI